MDEYLTTKEVAALLKRSTRCIRRWVEMGRLKPKRISRESQPLFHRSDVEKALADSEMEVPPPKREDPMMG